MIFAHSKSKSKDKIQKARQEQDAKEQQLIQYQKFLLDNITHGHLDDTTTSRMQYPKATPVSMSATEEKDKPKNSFNLGEEMQVLGNAGISMLKELVHYLGIII